MEYDILDLYIHIFHIFNIFFNIFNIFHILMTLIWYPHIIILRLLLYVPIQGFLVYFNLTNYQRLSNFPIGFTCDTTHQNAWIVVWIKILPQFNKTFFKRFSLTSYTLNINIGPIVLLHWNGNVISTIFFSLASQSVKGTTSLSCCRLVDEIACTNKK